MKKSTAGMGLLAVLVYGTFGFSDEKAPIKPQPPLGTEESVLMEKIDALQTIRKNVAHILDSGGGRGVRTTALHKIENELKSAQAELAAFRNETGKEIQYLTEAVAAAEKEWQASETDFQAGVVSVEFVQRAVIRRADAKLALIRAKKRHKLAQE